MTQRRAWALGGAVAALVSAPLAALELWPNPEPCRPCIVRVGETPAYCPDDRHEWRETWSEDYAVLYLECSCP